jgi:hypothetical protein
MDSALREDRCETCRFAYDIAARLEPMPDDPVHWICRRYPPVSLMQPDVDAIDWCGEWQPKYGRTYTWPTVEDVMAVANSPPSA